MRALLLIITVLLSTQVQAQDKNVRISDPAFKRLTAMTLSEAGAAKEIVDAASKADQVELHTLNARVIK